ncbi:MAG: CDP-diacylglycerol--glycerol-3-phosphate 3-phosphatidyltransferase [Hyphomicrobiales bacterium]
MTQLGDEVDPAVRPSGAGVAALPNLLTYARIAAVPVVVGCLLVNTDDARWIALWVYIAAAITDFFDGWLARRWAQVSSIGRMLDPIADKLLIASALLMLSAEDTISGVHLWAAIIILCREILVSGLREYLAELKVPLPVTRLAKWKTGVQLVAIGFLIAGPAGDAIFPYTTSVGIVGLWVAAILTLITGYDYFRAGVSQALKERP